MKPESTLSSLNKFRDARAISASSVLTDKAVRTMADAIFKHLQDEGCQAKDIINVSSQLLGLVTTQISSSDS
ncbi:MAG: hypothetical protein NTV34_18165 [Proteobacteria bacterium]|nr:hypothetical protein [Pseudomonadota bacterium]